MENGFLLDFTLQRRDYFEFGRVQTRRSKAWSFVLILALLLMFAYPALLAFTSLPSIGTFLTIGIFEFIYWFFADKILGIAAQNNMRKSTCSGYRFADDALYVFTQTANSAVAYGSIETLWETDRIFFLANGKNTGFIVPKSAVAPEELGAFRSFIEQKTQKSFRYTKSVGAKHYLFGAAVVVLLAASIFGAIKLHDKEAEKLYVHTKETYSISLPKGFRERNYEELGDYFYVLSDNQTTVLVLNKSKATLTSAFQSDAPTSSAEYLALLGRIYNVDLSEGKDLENGAYCASYVVSDDEGTSYYYFLTVMETDTHFWTTQFACKESSKMHSNFEKWAQSVMITE